MAGLRDERGYPIQLTDEHGNPVQLTDEFGNPMHLTGIATTDPSKVEVVDVLKPGGTGSVGVAVVEEDAMATVAAGPPPPSTVQSVYGSVAEPREDVFKMEKPHEKATHETRHSPSSSSSSSSEDDGQGGRRKKKGLKDKIKEKLTGGKHKDEKAGPTTTSTTTTTETAGSYPLTVEHHEQPHEKKSMIEKIKEKIPGHHHSSH